MRTRSGGGLPYAARGSHLLDRREAFAARTSRPARSVSLILDLSPDWLHAAEALQIVERLYVSYRTGELFPCCAPSLALFSASEEACLMRSFFGYHLTHLQKVGGGATKR